MSNCFRNVAIISTFLWSAILFQPSKVSASLHFEYLIGGAVSESDTTNAVMEDGLFWSIIDKSRKKAKGNFEKQKTILIELLLELESKSIVMFNNKFLSLIDAANYDKLFVAANLIKPHCGEECFVDFRSWLIGQGKQSFFRMVSEPDNLAELKLDATIRWDGLQECAVDAYKDLNKAEIPVTFKRANNYSSLPKWGENPKLVKKYLPKLVERQ
jgi:hypothetical protein